MHRKKVLIVAPENTKGGIGSVLQLYSSYLTNIEILYTYEDAKTVSRGMYFLQSLFSLVYKFYGDKQIGIVHIHTASYGSFYRKSVVLLLAKLFAKKTILHIHGGGFKQFIESSYIKGKWIISILQLADLNICLSQEWYAYFTEQWRLKKFVVLPNPILLPTYPKPNIYQHKIVLLYLGAVVQAKGIFDLIEFLSSYQKFQDGKIILHIGGEGDMNHLESLLDKCKMKEHIIIHGWVNTTEKENLFQQSDIYILPSYAEGLPMSILEAMAHAKPIIATHVGGIPSLVKNQENGWLFDPNNFNQLNQIFDDLFQYPDLLPRFGQNSYHLAEAYDIKKIAIQIEDLYEQVSSN